ncbi:MAG: hypothetical protein KKH68_05745 [Proteobacteria bacterium]|nr:hypothetical protein [Pseudomonadota bacterium]
MKTEKNVDLFSGNELDEPEDHEQVSAPEAYEYQAPVDGDTPKKRLPLLLGCLVIGIGLLAGAGYYFLKNNNAVTLLVQRSPIPAEQSLVFDFFVIPLKANTRFTYVSLSVSFKSRNQELIKEMTEKKDYFRGRLYEILNEEINKLTEVPPLDQLKLLIVGGVNRILLKGKVNNAYMMNYLAV